MDKSGSKLRDVPAGALLDVLGAWKEFATGVKVAIDVGSGLSAYSVAGAVYGAFGLPLLTVGKSLSNSALLYGGLVSLKIGPLTFGGVKRDTVAKALAA